MAIDDYCCQFCFKRFDYRGLCYCQHALDARKARPIERFDMKYGWVEDGELKIKIITKLEENNMEEKIVQLVTMANETKGHLYALTNLGNLYQFNFQKKIWEIVKEGL